MSNTKFNDTEFNEEIRALVDLYYTIQEFRKSADNKKSACERGDDTYDPVYLIEVRDQLEEIENDIEKKMEVMVTSTLLGKWALSIQGIGAVLAAGLMANIKLKPWRCCVKGHKQKRCHSDNPHVGIGCGYVYTRVVSSIYRFAGVDGKRSEWKKGERRPYNAALHTLCWKIGDQFRRGWPSESRLAMSVTDMIREKKEYYRKQGKPIPSAKELAEIVQKDKKRRDVKWSKRFDEDRIYSRIYADRKKQEVVNNEARKFREQALEKYERTKDNPRVKPSQKNAWKVGKLSDGGLDLRAMRVAEKIFLEHYHRVAYLIRFGKEPPVPYAFTKMGGNHKDRIPPPNFHIVKEGMKEIKEFDDDGL